MKSKSNVLSGLLISLVTLFLVIGVLEISLRVFLEEESDLYGGLVYDRDEDDDYFRRSFLELYPLKKDWRNGVYDPQLGWDQPHNVNEGRIAGSKEYGIDPEVGIHRIVTIGDSFVYGSYVSNDQTYSSKVEGLINNSEVLNMGVVAYGIDQSVLKYLDFGIDYQPEIVLFGTFPHGYVRSGLSFYGYSKPRFVYDPNADNVILTNTDIMPPNEMYDVLKDSINSPRFYSFQFLANQITKMSWNLWDKSSKTKYYLEMDVVIEHILKKIVDSTNKSGTRLLVVHVPHGNSFRNAVSFEAAKLEQEHVRLLFLYDQLEIQYIDLLSEFENRYLMEKVFNDLYIKVTETTRGHLTPEGHDEVAAIILEKLNDLGWVPTNE